ncbi:MAG TPA: BrnT family toxin [Casimicrobiaceae bacterium]|nr:BrnT family toxin [Casimicrobiaceae bacterium]
MIDLERVVGFEWDDGNARKNEKHGVSQSEAEQIFFDLRLLIVEDPGHSADEPRYHALGVTLDGRRLHVTFTLRGAGTRIRVISARDMHRKERQIYERED